MAATKHLSILGHSIYLFLTSLQLLFVPNLLLETFGFEPTSEVWIRVLGAVVLGLSVFYYGLSRIATPEILRLSVIHRLTVTLGFIVLALTGLAKINLILFAALDAITALWTWNELKIMKS
jgi:hypothetical protein